MDIDKLKQSTKKLKILFVEDSLTARRITQGMLSHFFDYIDVAKDGKVAIEMYRNFYNTNETFYDIVFTDLEMPNMNGKELSRLIVDFNPFQEIVVLSGINDFRMVVELINVGIKKFIAKPVQEDELQNIISEVMITIRKKKMKEEDAREVLEHNEYLKQRDEENKEILEAKVQELQEFSHALEVSAIVMKSDTKGVITYVNQQFCDVCGYSEEELIGSHNNMLKSNLRSSSYYKKLWNTINAKKTYKNLFENRHKDGSLYYIESTINPILDVNGEIVEFIAVSHDMTQLMKSMEATKIAQKSKEDFFVNISHEMKTPLNSILGFSALLQKRLKDDTKSLMMVNTIMETGSDLNNLVKSIIDMRQIQERTLILKELIFNPQEDIKKFLDRYAEKALEKNQEYRLVIDNSVPKSLLGDITRINQVIGIVVDNALKFTPQGGKIHTHIFYDSFSNILSCEVKDNGIGIAKENQEKVFAIEQLDAAANRSHEGVGIGLNIASNIIKIMKGEIKLKSIPQKGSLFTIEFPLNT